MNIALWIVQVILAGVFVFHGRMLLNPPAQVQPAMSYIHDLQPGLRRFIGALEILAGVGLILPALTNILPVLTPLAAAGLVIVMGGAAVYHLMRREYPNIAFNLILLALAAFVAYGRFVLVPM
ncbi:MAG: DoxX family protein [Anaerolineae bacterium]|nr:DoxX family protein [Anaerolineae bacterium]